MTKIKQNYNHLTMIASLVTKVFSDMVATSFYILSDT